MEAAKDAGVTVVSLPLVNQWTQVSHLELSLGDTYVSLTFTSGPIMETQTHKTPWGPVVRISKSGVIVKGTVDHLHDMLHAMQCPFLGAACAKQLCQSSSVAQRLDGLSSPCRIARAVVTRVVLHH